MDVKERFLQYVKVDTQSVLDADDSTFPSTEKQKDLGALLAAELLELGVIDARLDEFGYVYGTIPANTSGKLPVIGLIAHMDTAPECAGANVKPWILEGYEGGDVVLNQELGIILRADEYFRIKECVGKDMIFTDGTTLLGADDKAGIAEIVSAAEYLIQHPEIPHGEIKLAFTPDEEVGRGVAHFDYEGFGADFAYTVDGGALGQYNYENFNAANAEVIVNGRSIHTGAAKNQLKNALHIAMEFDRMLPSVERPAHTERYEGFVHLSDLTGTVEKSVCKYHVRDHDGTLFEEKKNRMTAAAHYLNSIYGDGTVEVRFKERYLNMAEKVRPMMHIVDTIRKSMERLGIVPNLLPIRGGTDGVSLSFQGIPCPNICSGVYHGHCRFECIPVQSLYQITALLVEIVGSYGKQTAATDSNQSKKG